MGTTIRFCQSSRHKTCLSPELQEVRLEEGNSFVWHTLKAFVDLLRKLKAEAHRSQQVFR